MTLNSEQQLAVNDPSPQIVCIAGAGSGKSSTIVARIQRLIADGIKPSEIVAISFTTAAAIVLQERLGVRLGFTGTIHSFCLRLIKEYGAEHLGIHGALTILDDDARREMIEGIMKEFRVKCSWETMEGQIKDTRTGRTMTETLVGQIRLAAHEYHNRCVRNNLACFDRILELGQRLMVKIQDSPNFRYKCVFLDEAQDCAGIDMQIVRGLPFEQVFICGDDAQAIYGFRNGDVRHLLALTQAAGWKVIALETNFRCRQAICEAAQKLIEHNAERYPKMTRAAKPGGIILVHEADCPISEKVFIANRLQMFYVESSKEHPFSAAVLTRTNRLADEIREYLRGCGIPVNERRAVNLPSDWRQAKLFLAFACDPANDFSALQYLAAKEGREKADAVRRKAAVACQSVNETYFQYDGTGDVVAAFSAQGFSPEARMLVHDAARRLSHVGEWSIQDLLLELSRAEHAEEEEQRGGVTVTTCHSAKGKEWKHVIVAGCESEWWDADTEEERSEQRRLFFVGMTRAEDSLAMTWCRSRPQWRGDNCPPGPVEKRTRVRFIEEAITETEKP